MSKPEYTDYRDKTLSKWHRELPDHWCFGDIDWIMSDRAGYVHGFVEEKDSSIRIIDINSHQLRTLRNVAKEKPAFILLVDKLYNHELNTIMLSFYLKCINKSANSKYESKYMSEYDYVLFEATIRREKPLTSVLARCSKEINRFPLPKFVNNDIVYTECL